MGHTLVRLHTKRANVCRYTPSYWWCSFEFEIQTSIEAAY